MHKDEKDNRILLTLLALVFVFPVLFLAVGSLMGKNELTDLLLPVLKTGSTGYASWKLFPEYPTLRSYVEVLLDSPEFFSHVLEFREDHIRSTCRQSFL